MVAGGTPQQIMRAMENRAMREQNARAKELLRGAKVAYEAIAPVYDEFTAHHNDEEWLSELLAALEPHGLAGGRLLDVGCGTGKSFIPMLERGWQVTACDISPAMLALAKEKVGEAAQLEVADMRKLPHFGYVDLVWALDDAVNYLLDREELEAGLAGMRDNLAIGGLLLFDLNTLRTYRTFFAETTTIKRGGLRLVWSGLAEADVPAGSICEARFEVEGGKVKAHLHRQRHFPELRF